MVYVSAEDDESPPEELTISRISMLGHIDLFDVVGTEQLNEGVANMGLINVVEDVGNANGKCA